MESVGCCLICVARRVINYLHNIPKNGMGLVPMGSHGGIGLVTICSHGGIAMGLALIMDFCGITKGFMRMI